MHAIVVQKTGGPEVMQWREVDAPRPSPGEALVRHSAIGLNFIDVYHRTGLYPVGRFPFTPGLEATGVVEAVGAGVTAVKPGERVVYASGPLGAYAETRTMPAERLVALPDWLDERTAAAAMLKGMTAEYLLHRAYPVQRGQTILVHAAAGGVGLILCQWAKSLGATVIGTVGSADKAELAAANGCEHPVIYTEQDFVARTRAITQGRGVAAVYDAVGRETFLRSFDCLMPRGMLVTFGQASGKPPPIDVALLGEKGSLFLTRPSLFAYTATREELVASASALFGVLRSGAVHVDVHQTFPLSDAARAHRELEGRKTIGSSVLLP